MAVTGRPAWSARTSPTKLATAPMSVRSRAKSASSPGMSKGAAWTRIISTPGDRRKKRHLVPGAQWNVLRHVLLIDGAAHHARARQRLGKAGVALRQPELERGQGRDLGRWFQHLFGAADTMLEPGEVADAHGWNRGLKVFRHARRPCRRSVAARPGAWGADPPGDSPSRSPGSGSPRSIVPTSRSLPPAAKRA